MIALRIVFLAVASAAMIWRAGQSALLAHGFYGRRDFANVARRLLVTSAIGLLGVGMFIYLTVVLLGRFRL